MRERLKKAIDRLQSEREALLATIDGLDQEQLDYRQAGQPWSAGQVINHVGLAEGVWQGYIRIVLERGRQARAATLRVGLDEVPFSSRFIPDFILRSPFVIGPLSIMMNFIPRPLQSMMFAVPLIKMDAGPRMQPKSRVSRAPLMRFMNDTRRTTLDLLAPVAELDLSRFHIVHPLVGDQDIYGIMELISSHDQRHAQQIDKIKRNSNFPRRQARTHMK